LRVALNPKAIPETLLKTLLQHHPNVILAIFNLLQATLVVVGDRAWQESGW
jgi:hypothetical protein